ncbi:hypothetical protein SISSUDRAFT_1123524 [Sistotremastrum suecicum HHB10207 ss-3]|uniref:F-box domain-containing protein n=1 Tax=Sistotremastrum suecicum HHB10207 ss-3 TaxID=1314776 RepID=A0A165XI41_9AGAM|nr:hypothetical protein SISSUDRAFT_1123524 [Sistotremastrum suecicum HHB10207 ss-3]
MFGAHVEDILAFSRVCRHLRFIASNARDLWLNACDACDLPFLSGQTAHSIPVDQFIKLSARTRSLATNLTRPGGALPKHWTVATEDILIEQEAMSTSPHTQTIMSRMYHVLPGNEWAVVSETRDRGDMFLWKVGSIPPTLVNLHIPDNAYVFASEIDEQNGVVTLAAMSNSFRWRKSYILEIGKSSNPDSTPEILTTTIIVNSKAVAEVTIRGPLLACTPPYSDHFLTIINWRARTGIRLNCLFETGEIDDGYQFTTFASMTCPRFHPELPVVFALDKSRHMPGMEDTSILCVDLPDTLPTISQATSDDDWQWTTEIVYPIRIHHLWAPKAIYFHHDHSKSRRSRLCSVISVTNRNSYVHPVSLIHSSLTISSPIRVLESNESSLISFLDPPEDVHRYSDANFSYLADGLVFWNLVVYHTCRQFMFPWIRVNLENTELVRIQCNIPSEISALKTFAMHFNASYGTLYGHTDKGIFVIQY